MLSPGDLVLLHRAHRSLAAAARRSPMIHRAKGDIVIYDWFRCPCLVLYINSVINERETYHLVLYEGRPAWVSSCDVECEVCEC
jgi:hypothetical protein